MGFGPHNIGDILLKKCSKYWYWDDYQVTGDTPEFNPYESTSNENPTKAKALKQKGKAQVDPETKPPTSSNGR